MKPLEPNPVKLFMGILYSSVDQLHRAKEALSARYGRIDFESEAFLFSVTDYYAAEMGSPINRVFICHEPLIGPEEIVRIKLETNRMEDQLVVDGKRKVNLDPGYMDTCKVILASAKYNGQKIYMARGIYADLTLYYEKGSFHPYPWSFPDFKSGLYNRPFLRIRELYKAQLKEMRRGKTDA